MPIIASTAPTRTSCLFRKSSPSAMQARTNLKHVSCRTAFLRRRILATARTTPILMALYLKRNLCCARHWQQISRTEFSASTPTGPRPARRRFSSSSARAAASASPAAACGEGDSKRMRGSQSQGTNSLYQSSRKASRSTSSMPLMSSVILSASVASSTQPMLPSAVTPRMTQKSMHGVLCGASAPATGTVDAPSKRPRSRVKAALSLGDAKGKPVGSTPFAASCIVCCRNKLGSCSSVVLNTSSAECRSRAQPKGSRTPGGLRLSPTSAPVPPPEGASASGSRSCSNTFARQGKNGTSSKIVRMTLWRIGSCSILMVSKSSRAKASASRRRLASSTFSPSPVPPPSAASVSSAGAPSRTLNSLRTKVRSCCSRHCTISVLL
mmetsp:Transcript_5668/g.15847  ORF Transcript_5668/g.15847 Transcript_5668/m.15847 type:complete len:382 (+) Transcript_5668:397-1542(+)